LADHVFARILRGEIPADFVHQDERCVAFRDVAPKAPVHLLVIPRRELKNIGAMGEGDRELLGHLLWVCRKVAHEAGLAEGGYRIVSNVGADGGQTVDHLHFHVLGGRRLGWPPG
jgi:histidine triad (HIT) family protein